MHIGKTGGTAIKCALKDHLNTSKGTILLHGHNTALADIPEGEKVFFFLRDPISRFISGFYSRQRKGQPRHFTEWAPKEKAAFEQFSSPNEIACGLVNGNLGARAAMNNIQHLNKLEYWFESLEYFKTRTDDMFFIGFQETLEKDFSTLKLDLDIHEPCTLPADNISAHRSSFDLNRSLEEHGISALNDWHQEDRQYISLSKKLMSIA